jgi:hypothetical protein
MSGEKRERPHLWPLAALVLSVLCTVTVWIFQEWWGALLIFGLFVVPSLILLGKSIQWRRQHDRFDESLRQWRAALGGEGQDRNDD